MESQHERERDGETEVDFEHASGQHPAGQHPAGQHPAGQHPAGQQPGGGSRTELISMVLFGLMVIVASVCFVIW